MVDNQQGFTRDEALEDPFTQALNVTTRWLGWQTLWLHRLQVQRIDDVAVGRRVAKCGELGLLGLDGVHELGEELIEPKKKEKREMGRDGKRGERGERGERRKRGKRGNEV